MSGSRLPVIAAMAANFGVAVAKFVAAAFTGSSSMVSEGIHSLVDSGDSVLLLIGHRLSRRPPDEEHPFGHGKELYVWTLVVAVLIFAVGAGLSTYEGIEHIRNPEKRRRSLRHRRAARGHRGDPGAGAGGRGDRAHPLDGQRRVGRGRVGRHRAAPGGCCGRPHLRQPASPAQAGGRPGDDRGGEAGDPGGAGGARGRERGAGAPDECTWGRRRSCSRSRSSFRPRSAPASCRGVGGTGSSTRSAAPAFAVCCCQSSGSRYALDGKVWAWYVVAGAGVLFLAACSWGLYTFFHLRETIEFLTPERLAVIRSEEKKPVDIPPV